MGLARSKALSPPLGVLLSGDAAPPDDVSNNKLEVSMTPRAWAILRAAIGLPGKAPVTEIPGHAIVAAMILDRARKSLKEKKKC